MTFETIQVRREGAVLFAGIAAPPMNLLGTELVRDLVSLIRQAEADDGCQVLVFTSLDPDYFIAHVDVTRISEYRQEAAKLTGEPSIGMLFRYLSASRLLTIAQIEGRVRGAGSEFVLACDMRFAAQESAIFSQPEQGFGLVPGAGGIQHLTRLMGRARALEVMLSADDYDAELAERYGWINRALPAAALRWVRPIARASDRRVSGRRTHRAQGSRQCDLARAGRRLSPRLGSLPGVLAPAGDAAADGRGDDARISDSRRGTGAGRDGLRSGRPGDQSGARAPLKGAIMSTIHFHQNMTSTPEQFIAGLTDFGPGRSQLFGNSADEYLKVHQPRSLRGGRHRRLGRHLGTPALRLVRSQPRRHDHDRLERLGRQLGPHLHLHAPPRRDHRPGRRRGAGG